MDVIVTSKGYRFLKVGGTEKCYFCVALNMYAVTYKSSPYMFDAGSNEPMFYAGSY